jgi:hypothetical protein
LRPLFAPPVHLIRRVALRDYRFGPSADISSGGKNGGAETAPTLECLRQKAAKAHLAHVREAKRNGKLKRTDLIAAVLQGTREMTAQEIITPLNKEFGWKMHRKQPHRSFVFCACSSVPPFRRKVVMPVALDV